MKTSKSIKLLKLRVKSLREIDQYAIHSSWPLYRQMWIMDQLHYATEHLVRLTGSSSTK